MFIFAMDISYFPVREGEIKLCCYLSLSFKTHNNIGAIMPIFAGEKTEGLSS